MIARPVHRRLPASSRSGFTLLEVLVVVAILVILASVATFAVVRYMRDAKLNQATLQMQKIEQACKAYFTQTGGNYPQSLQELVVPGQAGPPLLEGGADAITDPWGKPYNIDLESDSVGNQRLVVFTTDDYGQRITWPRR